MRKTLEVGSNVLVGVNRTFILDGVKSQLSKERNWLSEETQEVFRAIADLSSGSPTSLSKAIGKPPATIQYPLNILKHAGLLVTKGKPPTTKYYIKRDEEIGGIKNISR
jgi:DNA-binding transcriptional ArsR family regulator